MKLNNNDLQSFEELPQGWVKATLGEILPLTYGKALKKDVRDESGNVPVYGSSGQVGVHSLALTERPALIVGRKGSVGEVYRSPVPCWPIDTVYFVEEKDGHDLKYFEYLLKGLKLSKLDKSTAVPGLSRDDYNAVEVAVAPFAQQKRIVAEIEEQFSRLDEAVANLKRVKANLKRYKAAVLKAAVEGKLTKAWRKAHPNIESASKLLDRILAERRAKWEEAELAKMEAKGKAPKDDKWKAKYKEPEAPDAPSLPELPKGWTWASAEQISEFITKGTTPSADKLSEGTGDIQFLKVYNLTFDGTLNYGYKPAFVSSETHDVELARSKVRAGDVLINIVGPPLGQVSVVPMALPEANINQAIARFRPLKPLSTEFLSFALMSEVVMGWAIRRAKTTAGQSNLTLELCRELPIPLPPSLEQSRIVAEVDRRLTLIRETEIQADTNLQRAGRLRQSLLAKAFMGGLTAGSDCPAHAAEAVGSNEPTKFTATNHG